MTSGRGRCTNCGATLSDQGYPCDSCHHDPAETGPVTRRRVLGVLGVGALGSVGAYAMNLPPQGKLVVNDGDDWDAFGDAVALSADGTTALVGAVSNDVPGTRQDGSAYVFRGTGRSKDRTATFTPESGDETAPPVDGFGNTVALSDDGTTAIVGKLWNPPDLQSFAHVFSESGGSWDRTAKLRPEDSGALGDGENYGGVTLSGDGETALVGLLGESVAYAFSVSGESWRRTATFDFDGEVATVALSNDAASALVATTGTPEEGEDAVHALSRVDGSWRRDGTIPADYGLDVDGLDVELSGDGTTALLGDPLDDAGSAHVLSRASGSWAREAKLVPDDGDGDDAFGSSVSLSRDGATALVGAVSDEDPHGERSGSAYVFSAPDGSWRQDRKLTAGDGDRHDQFGQSVALSDDGTTAIVGAPDDEDTGLPVIESGRNERSDGSAYVFTL